MDQAEISKLKSKTEPADHHGLFFEILKWGLITLIGLAIISLITKPIRKNWALDSIDRGDAYLLQKKYLSADIEYRKANLLYKTVTSTDRAKLAADGAEDISKLEKFYSEKNVSIETTAFAEATKVPSSEKIAVETSRDLIEKQEYQLAILPAKTATEMNKGYRDAWLYLGISNLLTAQNVELSVKQKNVYLNAAKSALEKAKTIDPLYQPTLDYLKESQSR